MLDKLESPDAVTLAQIRRKAATGDFDEWLSDRRNRPSIPHRMERCGYTPLRNDGRRRWAVEDQAARRRQAIYVKATLTGAERLKAARKLAG